jgi:hypothetical protein
LAEHKRSRLDSGKREEADAPPIVGVHFLWDGDVLAEEAPLRLERQRGRPLARAC